MALAAAHDALIQQHWTSASLAEVVGKALAPHISVAGDRLRVQGDDTRLNARSTLALTMCLHELATNAAKYGALSNETGQVRISWSADGERLVLRWEEHGGPPVEPPTTRGFGSKLLERIIAGDLGGESRMTFAPEGLVCVITARLGD
jgi:two-component sensor histidine kinase